MQRLNSQWLVLAFFGVSLVACLSVYRHALHGPFISDDSFYIIDLARNYTLDWEFVAHALSPWSDLRYEIMNYAPLYAITSRVEVAAFGPNPFGYHVVNVVFHALNASLLFALLRKQGVADNWAMIAAAFFALHPANVEAVAWISQLRSIFALGFALAAILALERHPALSMLLFAAGLLAKASALFALPIAGALYWCAKKQPARESISLGWLCGWVVVFALYAVPQFTSFSETGRAVDVGVANGFELFRHMAAIGSRYLLMAATSIGVSAWQAPAAPQSWLNPWWLVSLPIGVILSWRIVRGLVRQQPEAAYWLGAAAAFGPVSQLFPFYFAMGDRYLYFILPGLLVATLLWWGAIRDSVSERSSDAARTISRVDLGLRVMVIALVLLFAQASSKRAALWQHEGALMVESFINYPEGGVAYYVRSIQALEKGDIDEAVTQLRGVIDTNYYKYVDIFNLPQIQPYQGHPDVMRLRARIARLTIERFEGDRATTQHQMRAVASAYYFLGKHDAAIAKLEEALRFGGPLRDAIFADMDQIREAKRQAQARAGK